MSGNRMNGYTDKTNATLSTEELLPTMGSQLPLSDITKGIYHGDNFLSRNLSSQISSDSASSVSMSSSGYERQVSTRLPSFVENKDHFDFKGDSLSPRGSLSTVHDTNFLNDRIRCLESEKLTIMVDHNNLIRDFNKRMQSYLEEIRTLKEVNQTVEQELSDLRDLCCFLDDDRRKCRKLAKEWQKFGRNTVTTLKTEVSAYQQRQTCLEDKNSQLVQESSELRELCFHLDQKVSLREDKDSEIETTIKYTICPQCSDKTRTNSECSQDDSKNITTLQNKVQQLEREKDMLHRLLTYGSRNHEKKRVYLTVPDDGCDSSSTASELDFPPSAINLELLRKSNHLQDNLDVCSNGMSSLNIHASGINEEVGVNSVVYDQSPPLSHPRFTSELLKLGRERNIQLKNEKLNIPYKNRECEGETNLTNLPAYEDSVRYLEASRINTSKIDDFTNKSIASKSDAV